MKKLTVVALLLVAITHLSMADPKNPNKVSAEVSVTSSPVDQKKAIIKIDNLAEGQNSFLKIKDKKGRLLHAETIHKGTTFTRAYDFSKVANGEYIVELRTKGGKITQSFTIQDSEVEEMYFKPVIKTEADMIRIVFQNPLDTPLSLKLYSKNGHELYSTTVAAQEVFAHGFNTTFAKNKEYRLNIKNKVYSFSKEISTR